MTAHVWKWCAEGLVSCDLCGEVANAANLGAPYPNLSGPYATCEDYRAAKRHVFRPKGEPKGLLQDCECVQCGVILGYHTGKLEEFQARVHGEVGDCDKAALFSVRRTLEA